MEILLSVYCAVTFDIFFIKFRLINENTLH